MEAITCPLTEDNICVVACPAAEMAVVALLKEHRIIHAIPACSKFSGIAENVRGDERFFRLNKTASAVRCFAMVAESFILFKPGRSLYAIMPDGSRVDLCKLSIDQIENTVLRSNILAIFDVSEQN